MKTVVQVIGLGYSGSSLLNLLLDSVHKVRGLGEINLVYSKIGGPCGLCQKTIEDSDTTCTFYDGVGVDYYKDLFALYPESKVLVDSSKIDNYERREDFRYSYLYTVKYPHEFVSSYVRHKGCSIEHAFEYWLVGNNYYSFGLNEYHVVEYRSLALNTEKTLIDLCRILDVHFSTRSDWWDTDTHIIGGNWSVKAQINSNFGEILQEGKYQGRKHLIFLDEAWRKDQNLIDACRRLYIKYQNEVDRVLGRLNLPDVSMMVEDLQLNRSND